MKITQATIQYYPDNAQYQACITWADGSQTVGTIRRKNSCFLMRWSSFELGPHLRSIFQRIERENFSATFRRGLVIYTPATLGSLT